MSKNGYDIREFVMMKPTGRDKEGQMMFGVLGGKVFKRKEAVDTKAFIVRGRAGYLSKGGKPYDELEGAKCFATYLKTGVIRELKKQSNPTLFDQ